MTTTTKFLIALLAVLAAIVLVAPALPGPAMGPGMMWGYGGPYGGPWGWHFFAANWLWRLALGVRAVTMLAFWGVIAVGIALLVRWVGSPDRCEHHQ